MWIWIIIIAGMGFVFQLIDKILFNNIVNNTNSEKKVQTEYQEKPIMTASEISFYNKIKTLESTYKILPQINLATIIRKNNNNKYYTDLFRNIDFSIMSNDYSKVLLLIELNDATHEESKRKLRDKKINNICKSANIPLIKFYTKYPNEPNYVINRIINEINNHNNNIIDNGSKLEDYNNISKERS